jgi:hypothetical protein
MHPKNCSKLDSEISLCIHIHFRIAADIIIITHIVILSKNINKNHKIKAKLVWVDDDLSLIPHLYAGFLEVGEMGERLRK